MDLEEGGGRGEMRDELEGDDGMIGDLKSRTDIHTYIHTYIHDWWWWVLSVYEM